MGLPNCGGLSSPLLLEQALDGWPLCVPEALVAGRGGPSSKLPDFRFLDRLLSNGYSGFFVTTNGSYNQVLVARAFPVHSLRTC